MSHYFNCEMKVPKQTLFNVRKFDCLNNIGHFNIIYSHRSFDLLSTVFVV